MPNWKEVLEEIAGYQSGLQQEGQAKLAQVSHGHDLVRRKYLTLVHESTGRCFIAYYSGWLSKPNVEGIEINDEDVNGFMATVHQLPRVRGLDLLLHTPGGGLTAAMSIVHYLRQMFDDDLRVIVPQIAMSAGTIIACASKQILMTRHSQLGPTDPQLRGIAAAGVKFEFERACREVKDDPSRIPIWQSIIGSYSPTFLDQCELAVDQARTFVRSQLATNMFKGRKGGRAKARGIAEKLTDFGGNKSHDQPFFFEDCERMGLDVALLEDDQALQDAVLSAHHCYMHAFMNGPAFKIIENHAGTAIVKRQVQIVQRVPE